MEKRINGYDEFMIILNEEDSILELWQKSTDAELVDFDLLSSKPSDIPVSFRGLKRRVVDQCLKDNRDFYYIDTGYFGNLYKRKDWHRIVKNNVQHLNPIEVPSDRWVKLLRQTKNIYNKNWRKGSKILVVTPSEKPCKFYGITKDQWTQETLRKLREHTDREIIIREKQPRRERIGSSSIYHQLVQDDICSLVTYNSIAATEAVAFGVPAFCNAPNAAQSVCSNDFTQIENPYYPDREKVDKWLHWLAYCQYHVNEISDGTAYKIQQEYEL